MSQAQASPAVDARTLPAALLELAASDPDHVALREKRLGIWEEITRAGFRDRVAATALWLQELGATRGDYVAVFSENRAEWLYTELAIMLMGGVSLGIHPGTYAEELDDILRRGKVRLIFCGGQEEVDRLRSANMRHAPQRMVVFDSRGTRQYTDERLLFWEDGPVTDAGLAARVGADLSQAYHDLAAGLDPDAICLAVSSSGRADYPRQALFTHRALLKAGDEFQALYAITHKDRNLCYLPLCHFIETLFSVVLPLRAGNVPHIVESDDTVLEDLREVSPTLFASWPRFWDRMRLMTLYRMSQTSLVREFFFDSFTRAGNDRVKFSPDKKTFYQRLQGLAGDQLFFRAYMNRLGLRDCRIAFSTAGELKEHVIQWFLGMGLPLTEFFGTTETMGAGFANTAGTEHAGTAGKPFPDLRFRFARDRELMIKGPYLAAGYLDEAGKPPAPLPGQDGWFFTGDTGFEDARDRLRVTGNKYTIIENADRESFSIKRTEEVIRECPYVREVVCFGENLPFVSALIELDFDRVSDEVRLENVRFKRYEDLLGQEAVTDLLRREINKLNEDLIEVEKVRAFRFFPEELREEQGELAFDYTPRRRVIARKYKALLDEMYTDE